jgi:hypothetical protein
VLCVRFVCRVTVPRNAHASMAVLARNGRKISLQYNIPLTLPYCTARIPSFAVFEDELATLHTFLLTMLVLLLLVTSFLLTRSLPAFGFVQIVPRTRALLRPPSSTKTASPNFNVRHGDRALGKSSSLNVLSEAIGHSSTYSNELSSLLTSVEFFDGSSVVDPVVVSGAFWTSLTTKLFSLVLGQLAATLIFGLVLFLGASQLRKFTESLSSKLLQDTGEVPTSSTFRRFPETQSPPPIQVRQEDLVRLFISILVDLIGTSSEVVPVVGEISDLVWAPIAGLILRSMYGSNVVLIFEVAEEILPFTDFLPFATICWTVDVFFADSEIARALRIGQHRSTSPEAIADESVVNGERPSSTPGSVLDVQAVSLEDDVNPLKPSERNNP